MSLIHELKSVLPLNRQDAFFIWQQQTSCSVFVRSLSSRISSLSSSSCPFLSMNNNSNNNGALVWPSSSFCVLTYPQAPPPPSLSLKTPIKSADYRTQRERGEEEEERWSWKIRLRLNWDKPKTHDSTRSHNCQLPRQTHLPLPTKSHGSLYKRSSFSLDLASRVCWTYRKVGLECNFEYCLLSSSVRQQVTNVCWHYTNIRLWKSHKINLFPLIWFELQKGKCWMKIYVVNPIWEARNLMRDYLMQVNCFNSIF